MIYLLGFAVLAWAIHKWMVWDEQSSAHAAWLRWHEYEHQQALLAAEYDALWADDEG